MLLDSTEESRIASTSDSRRTANPQSHDVEQNSTVLTINDLRQWSPETAFSTSSSSSFNVTETTDVSGVAIDDRTIAKNTAPPAAPASTSLNADEYTYKSYGDHTKRRQKRREVGAQLRNTSSSVESTMSSENEKWRWNARFSAFIDALFRRLGLFIVDHNRSILVIVFLLTTVLSIKIPFTPQRDDIKTGYTPNGARSHVEAMLFDQFYRNYTSLTNSFPSGSKPSPESYSDPLSVVVFIEALDGDTMLRETHLNETVEIIDHLSTQFTLAGKNFYEVCTDFCQLNEPIRQFKNGFIIYNRRQQITEDFDAKSLKSKILNPAVKLQLDGRENDEESFSKRSISSSEGGDDNKNVDDSTLLSYTSHRINLTFPFVSILGLTLDMSPHFFGVQKYVNERPLEASRDDVIEWERAMAKYLHKEMDSKYVRGYMLSVAVVGDEIVRTGMTMFPYISVGFTIMSTFSIITVYISATYFKQWTVHKISLAFWACICPLLATSSALGFLFWFGFRFGTILAVSPFLIMAIGVDDAYLMIHSWQRICVARVSKMRQQRKVYEHLQFNLLMNKELRQNDLRERIAEMLVDVGPSITITSLTNVFAFIIGIFSPTPEIQLFCAGNATAIFFDFLYQLFMFTPIIVVAGQFEMNIEEKKLIGDMNNQSKTEESFIEESMEFENQSNGVEMQKGMLSRFMSRYCNWLSDDFTALIVFFILIVYWCVSLKGALNIDVNITPKKLFLSDSFINHINALRDQYILSNYTAVSVFVNKVGDLNDPARLERIRQFVDEYERMPNNLGAEYTHFWLRDFDDYAESMNEDTEEDDGEEPNDKNALRNSTTLTQKFRASQIHAFLNWPEYRHWHGFMRLNDDFLPEKFFAVLAYHGADLVEWHRRSQLLTEWRRIAGNYSDLEAWVWADDAQFLDQIDTLVPATVQSSAATLVCMMIVCGIFMSNLFTVIVATLAIISICIGVFGFLALWSIDLDPISMATTIMSIGFSVDFPAHVTYHYYKSGLDSVSKIKPQERICRSLIAIGFPLLQCGFSTILFVLCLLFVDTYMSEVFVKTMVLVVSLGLLHGLFVVPTLLCALTNIYEVLCGFNWRSHWISEKLSEMANRSPFLKHLVSSSKPALKIRRRLSKKNISRVSVISPA